MPIPDYESLMPTVLRLATSERTISDAVLIVSDECDLSEEERQQLIPSGGKPLIKSRVEWAVTYLVQAGVLERPRRGHFLITQRGQEVLNDPPEKLDSQYLRRFPEFVDFLNRHRKKRSQPTSSTLSDDKTNEILQNPEETLGEAYSVMEEELSSELLTRVLKQSPGFFERLVVTLLRSMGYGSEETLAKAVGRPGDGGIDGIIHEDKLGLDAVYLQAKKYDPSHSINRPDLQAFVGSLAGASAQKGIFVTTSSFSSGALEYLKTIPQRVVTIDGKKLVLLMIEHNVGVKELKNYIVHRVDEDFFTED